MNIVEIKGNLNTQMMELPAKRSNHTNAPRFIATVLIMLCIYPFTAKSQPNSCGAKVSFFMAGDSLMFAHQLLTGATNYSLKIRKSSGGRWVQPTGDVVSGCSKLSYFVLYMRDQPNACQHYKVTPGSYQFEVTAYNDVIGDSCVMTGDFYLTGEQAWKSTYSSWDILSAQNAPIFK